MHDGLRPAAGSMTHYWFKPKRHGYGATPVTWQGWGLTLGAAALLVWLTFVFIAWPGQAHTGPQLSDVLTWAALEALGIAGLVLVTRAKTEGSWKWRWGDE